MGVVQSSPNKECHGHKILRNEVYLLLKHISEKDLVHQQYNYPIEEGSFCVIDKKFIVDMIIWAKQVKQ